MSSLVRSNRNIQPKNQANISDFDDKSKNKDGQKAKENNVTTVTFNTNLKMSNHTRNYLQSIALLGFAENQKSALDIAISAYLDSLTKEERDSIELQYKTLEKRDVNAKNKK